MFKGIGHFPLNQKETNKTRTNFVARSFILLFLKERRNIFLISISRIFFQLRNIYLLTCTFLQQSQNSFEPLKDFVLMSFPLGEYSI